MLRTFFVRLSENHSLRPFAERSSIGRRVSHRFVAGIAIADAISVTQALNRAGMSVTVDNLGENVHNLDEARASAQLYHQILDAVAAQKLNANISLKRTHMGLDVDEQLARDLVAGLVAKAASMRSGGFVRVDMEGSPYTQRTLDFVHQVHRTPANQDSIGTVIQAYLYRSEKDIENCSPKEFGSACVKGLTKNRQTLLFPKKLMSMTTTSG